MGYSSHRDLERRKRGEIMKTKSICHRSLLSMAYGLSLHYFTPLGRFQVPMIQVAVDWGFVRSLLLLKKKLFWTCTLLFGLVMDLVIAPTGCCFSTLYHK